MKPKAFAHISNTLWAIPDQVGKFSVVSRSAITDTDQQTKERKWIAKKTRENNNNNLDTFLVMVWTHVIPQAFYIGGNTMGRGGFGELTPIEILGHMQARYGIPGAQEEEDALRCLKFSMNHDDPPEVMILSIE